MYDVISEPPSNGAAQVMVALVLELINVDGAVGSLGLLAAGCMLMSSAGTSAMTKDMQMAIKFLNMLYILNKNN